MQLTRNRITVAIGAIVLVVLAFWGYQFSRSVGNLGQMLGGSEAPAPPGPYNDVPYSDAPGSSTAEGAQISESVPEIARPGSADTTAADRADPADLRQEVLEVRREVSRVLVNDPELLASLDELFDEPDEDILRENLEILREAFLDNNPDFPDID